MQNLSEHNEQVKQQLNDLVQALGGEDARPVLNANGNEALEAHVTVYDDGRARINIRDLGEHDPVPTRLLNALADLEGEPAMDGGRGAWGGKDIGWSSVTIDTTAPGFEEKLEQVTKDAQAFQTALEASREHAQTIQDAGPTLVSADLEEQAPATERLPQGFKPKDGYSR